MQFQGSSQPALVKWAPPQVQSQIDRGLCHELMSSYHHPSAIARKLEKAIKAKILG